MGLVTSGDTCHPPAGSVVVSAHCEVQQRGSSASASGHSIPCSSAGVEEREVRRVATTWSLSRGGMNKRALTSLGCACQAPQLELLKARTNHPYSPNVGPASRGKGGDYKFQASLGYTVRSKSQKSRAGVQLRVRVSLPNPHETPSLILGTPHKKSKKVSNC